MLPSSYPQLYSLFSKSLLDTPLQFPVWVGKWLTHRWVIDTQGLLGSFSLLSSPLDFHNKNQNNNEGDTTHPWCDSLSPNMHEDLWPANAIPPKMHLDY